MNDRIVKAAIPLSDHEAVPEGFTKAEWGKIRVSIERDVYRIHNDNRTGAYQAPNHTHDLDTNFTKEGFEVRPHKGSTAWRWGLRFSGCGYRSDIRPPSGARKMVSEGNRIEYRHGDIVEWYVNDHRGLEQGFTLYSRPRGRQDSGPLQVQMSITGNLYPEVENDGKGIV